MRHILIVLFALVSLTGAANAQAPTTVKLCLGTQPNCPAVATANPLPIAIVSGGAGGGPVTIADGADVAEGSTTDAAATAGSTGTVSGKLRFLTSVAFATSTNQTSQITQETAINTILGLQADAACSTDNGTCTVAALLKRNNQRLTTLLTGPLPISIASAQVVSGAYASGSLASGAVVDVVALQAPVAPATATATKSILLGAQATTAAVNPTTGQQGALSSDTNNNLLVSAGGAPNLAIAQVSIATSDTLAVAARALRRSVTIQQITGTQNVFCNQTTATAGNGVVLPATVGASFTFNTTSAIRCIAITGAQTVAIAETY